MKKSSQNKLVKKINENFIKKQNEIKKILDLNKNYQTQISKRNYDVLEFNIDDKFQFSTKFNYYGIVDENNNFHWANTFHGVDLRFMKNIEKIKSKISLFEGSNDPDILLYYQILNSDKFLLDFEQQFKFIKLLMYLDDSYYFLEPQLNDSTKAIITLKEHNSKKFYEKKI